MQKGFVPIMILAGILVIMAVAGGVFYLGRATNLKPSPSPVVISRTPRPTPSSNVVSQECGVCGPKSPVHNIYGRQCAKGLECKNIGADVVSSVYYCVKPGNSIKTCLENIEKKESE